MNLSFCNYSVYSLSVMLQCATIFNDSLPEKDYQSVIETLLIEILPTTMKVQDPLVNTQHTAKQLKMSP